MDLGLIFDVERLRFLFGQIFSLFSTVSFILASIKKDKEKMIFWNLSDSLCIAFSYLFFGAYSAAVVNVVGIVRNALKWREHYNKVAMIICLILVVVTGIMFNNRGWIGYLAILSGVVLTIGTYKTQTARGLRWVFLTSTLLLVVHDLMIRAYLLVLVEVIAILGMTVNLIRLRKAEVKKKRKIKSKKR